MADDARLTVITPVKNPHPLFLDEALASMRDQTSARWELSIVVEPAELARHRGELAAWTGDPRIRVEANEGRRLAGAVNTGMRRAATAYVALLLADDMWAPNAVEVLEGHFDRFPDADFFHSGRRVVDDRGQPVSTYYPPRPDVRVDAFADAGQAKHLLCWRRDLGLAVGGLDERFLSTGPDDYDFPWTMAERGATFCAVNACLYLYRDHRSAERLTTHVPLSVHTRELRRVLAKHGVGRRAQRRRVAASKATYLKQCLYRNRPERWLRGLLDQPPKRVWRDSYR